MRSEPDTLEKCVRFACGIVLGLVFGFFYFLANGIQSIEVFVLLLAIFSIFLGWLAMKYGDAFWKNFFKFPWP